MNKEEFLKLMRQALSGDVPPSVIEENIRYYDSYISGEVRKGQTESEVIAAIGDPRLIAKTIEETTDGAGDGPYSDSTSDRSTSYRQTAYERNPYEQSDYDRSPYETNRHFHMIDLSKWYWKLLLVVLVFAIISIIISVVGGIFMILAPFIGPLFLIWLVVWIFRMFNNRN